MTRGPEQPDWGQYDDDEFVSEERTEALVERLDDTVDPIVAELDGLSFSNQMLVLRCVLDDLYPKTGVEMHLQFAEHFLANAAHQLSAARDHSEAEFDAEFEERLDDLSGLSAKFAEEVETERGEESMEEFAARKAAEMEELLDAESDE